MAAHFTWMQNVLIIGESSSFQTRIAQSRHFQGSVTNVILLEKEGREGEKRRNVNFKRTKSHRLIISIAKRKAFYSPNAGSYRIWQCLLIIQKKKKELDQLEFFNSKIEPTQGRRDCKSNGNELARSWPWKATYLSLVYSAGPSVYARSPGLDRAWPKPRYKQPSPLSSYSPALPSQ